MQEQYAQKAKDLEINERVQRSAALGAARVTKMKARDDLLEDLKKECIEKLAAFCKGPGYPDFLKQIIVQGLIKIEEPVVDIQCRDVDKEIVNRVLPEAVAEFKKLMTEAGHVNVSPKVKISASVLNPKLSNGGVVLTACNDKIILDQTVNARFNITFKDMMPAIRSGLFKTSA